MMIVMVLERFLSHSWSALVFFVELCRACYWANSVYGFEAVVCCGPGRRGSGGEESKACSASSGCQHGDWPCAVGTKSV